MADRTEREVLNTLIVACRDADHGFTFAADRVLWAPLRELFTDLARERRQFADELLPHSVVVFVIPQVKPTEPDAPAV